MIRKTRRPLGVLVSSPSCTALSAGTTNAVNLHQAVDQRPAKPIDPRDNQATRNSSVDAPQRLLQQRSIAAYARLVKLLEDRQHRDVPRRSPRLDLLALDLGGDEALATTPTHPRHADVAVHRGKAAPA
jgi:hypothetical protein